MANATVVVGTDLGESATEALRQAAAWAARSCASLVVVHVVPDEVFGSLEIPKVVEALGRRVEPVVDPFDVRTEIVVEPGSPYAELVRVADRRGAALLVVGASGAHGVGRVLFGGTAEQTLRYAHCSVVIAREAPERGPVLAATDFSEEGTLAVNTAAEEARARQVPLRLAHVPWEPAWTVAAMLGPIVVAPPAPPEAELADLRRAQEETLRTVLGSTGVPGDVAVLDGSPATAITEHARAVGASLLVVGARGHTRLERALLGSVAESVARRAPCSVFAARPERR